MDRSHYYDGTILFAPKSEESYFYAYRARFPHEAFAVYSLEELCDLFRYHVQAGAVDFVVQKGYSKPEASMLLSLLRAMTGKSYKSTSLQKLLPLRDELLQGGYFQIQGDPVGIFKGKTMIIRGYYSGKYISETIQDLPNICLNWDLERPMLRKQPLPILEVSNHEEAMRVLQQKIKELVTAGEHVALRYDGDEPLPKELSSIPVFQGPYPPYGYRVVSLESKRRNVLTPDLFDAFAMAELHLPSSAERLQREAYDEDCFSRHPYLCARVYEK